MNIKDNYTLEGTELKIYTYPAPVLKEKAKEIVEFGPELKNLAKDMLFTMYHAPGIGLAAPQIGKSIRMFVLDVEFERELITNSAGNEEYRYSNFHPMIFINPSITETKGKTSYKEGCLSVPDIYEEVSRDESITVTFQDINGNTQQIVADGLLSICIQHELDHLNGIVFLERLSTMKRNFFKKKLIKQSTY